MDALTVVGAGGHAKVVIATARAAGVPIAGVVDDDAALWGQSIGGIAIRGAAAEVLGRDDTLVVLAVGSNAARRRLAETARCRFATLVHPSAVVESSVALGPGTVVFAGAVLQPDTVVGVHAIINTGASVDHDGRLGDFAHIAPGARLAGSVTVGAGTLIGIGAAVIPGCRIGAWSIVGAGAAVVTDIPDGVTVVGAPARVHG